MQVTAVVILVVALVALWFRFSPELGSQRLKSPIGSPYHAVSIECETGTCNAVQQIEGNRFLSSEAPLLPLPDCASEPCNCKYVHHEDRRGVKKDRRSSIALIGKTPQLFVGPRRRFIDGRRRSDWRSS